MYLGEKEYSGSDPLQKCKHILNVCACVCACILIYAKVCDCHNIFSGVSFSSYTKISIRS